MAGNLSQSGMKLLELPDDDLLNIFSYLDQKSQFNTMLVCQRFERLIGQTYQFFKNRKLVITGQSPNDLKTIRRYFGKVTFYRCRFSPDLKVFSISMAALETIGSKIDKLEIRDCEGFKDPVLDVIRMASNMQELIIEKVAFIHQPKSLKYNEVDLKQLNFPQLVSLKLSSIANFEFIQEAIFGKTSLEQLRCLELDHVTIVENIEWRNSKIKKLILNGVRFPWKEAFQSFKTFILSLGNVSSLEIDIVDDGVNKCNNYSKILTHLLNMKTLGELKLNFPDSGSKISIKQVPNPSVKTCIFEENVRNCSKIFRYFPNVQMLGSLHNGINDIDTESLSSLGTLNHLRELTLTSLSAQQMLLIKCSQMKKLSIMTVMDNPSPPISETFAQNNPAIEHMELLVSKSLIERYMSAGLTRRLSTLIKSFPKLKILKAFCQSLEDTSEIVKAIGENFTELEYLELTVNMEEAEPSAICRVFQRGISTPSC
jgi:hypothetical protein